MAGHYTGNMQGSIEKAALGDIEELTALTLVSKAYWGYSPAQIEAWRGELTVTEDYLRRHVVYTLAEAGKMVGYYAYFRDGARDIKLDSLFVLPAAMGKGVGRKLMLDFFARIASEDFDRVVLDADPHAERFYAKLGFRVVGQLPTAIAGRYLPMMMMSRAEVAAYGINRMNG